MLYLPARDASGPELILGDHFGAIQTPYKVLILVTRQAQGFPWFWITNGVPALDTLFTDTHVLKIFTAPAPIRPSGERAKRAVST
jgi:hypothetical protein